MSQDSSLVGSFNLGSQSGVMAVLAAIRASKITPAEKNELRDLVFAYTNGGGDASVRIALEHKLATHQISPVVMQRSGQVSPTLSFGSYRPTPQFKEAPKPNPAPTPVRAEVAIGSPVDTPTPAPVTPTPPPISQPAPAPEPAAPAAPVVQEVAPVAVVPAPVPVPVQTAPIPEPAPVPPPAIPTPAPQSAPVPTVSGTTEEAKYLERIRQIKTAVNSQVGNPVNLVDIDNVVGREYMNALLEAMKKLGGGAVSEMGAAMERLETAYAAVEVAIKNNNSSKSAAPVSAPVVASAPAPVPATPPLAPSAPLPPPMPPRPVPPAPAPTPVPPRPIPQAPQPAVVPPMPPRPAPTATPKPIPAPVEAEASYDIMPLPTRPPVPPMPPRPTPTPVAPRPMPPLPQSVENPQDSGFAVPEAIAKPAPKSAALSDVDKVLTPADLPEASSLSTSEGGDPLFTQEIDSGLEQLLADWSLFKKSGLFGTGPKGREHPLFKKIADLQVPLLLAGRFEGANQEIRQSITDYMNGWRYEQGIVYQPGETFEKYLRRVIKHILDLQKKRSKA